MEKITAQYNVKFVPCKRMGNANKVSRILTLAPEESEQSG
jgi:hypothetical protein